ncbi:MAG: TIM barrel protein [Thermosphaera sp.]
MRVTFSTMVLLSLEPAKAIKILAGEGIPVEVAYDNFRSLGGMAVEDELMRRACELADEGVREMIRSVHMPYDGIEVDAIPMDIVIKRMLKWLDFAHRLEASITVFHTLECSLREFEVNLEFFRRMAREAADRGIKVAVENRLERRLFGSNPRDLKLLIESVGDNIGACADVGHANINRNLSQLLKTLDNSIIEVHLHDNDGEKDEHKPPFTGSVSWGLVLDWLKRRKEDINIVFEILCPEQTSKCLTIAKDSASAFNDTISEKLSKILRRM